MAGEEIELKLAVPDGFFTELDRRFEALARRASAQFGNAARLQSSGMGGGGGGGASGNVPGGGAGGSGGGGGAGAFGTAAAAIFAGAGQGIAATPAASSSSPGVLAQNATLGAAQGGVSLAKGALTGLGAALGSAAGPVGTAVGAGAGNVLGDLIQGQFNSVKDAMEVPTERGVNRLKSVYGNFAAAGVTTTEEEREQAIKFSIQIERRRYEGERNLERQYREIAARDSLSQGLSWVGR